MIWCAFSSHFPLETWPWPWPVGRNPHRTARKHDSLFQKGPAASGELLKLEENRETTLKIFKHCNLNRENDDKSLLETGVSDTL